MENSFSKVVSIFIAAVIMIMIPVKYFEYNKKELVQEYVSTETIRFVDDVRNTGILDEDYYLKFCQKLMRVAPGCNIDIQISKPINDSTGKVLYYECFYRKQIEKELSKNKECRYNIEDYLRVEVRSSSGYIYTYYGGMIRDEAY